VKIGITTDFRKPLYSNGLTQNLHALYEVVKNAGGEPEFIDFSDYFGPIGKKGVHKSNKITNKKITQYGKDHKPSKGLDMLLCAGVSLNQETKDTLNRANKNCRFVSVRYGNTLFTRIQNWFSRGSERAYYPAKERGKNLYDYLLTSPHFKYSHDFFTIKEQCPVGEIPFVWNPKIMENLAKGRELNYKPAKKPNLAVLDPNLGMEKNFLIPLLAIKHLLKNKPDIFNEAYIFNGRSIVKSEKNIENYILNALEIGDHPDRVFFDGDGEATPNIFHKDNPFIVSHQILCELNYTYLEALYFGYPLIHNSDALKDVGYFYPEFEAIKAAEQIENAILNHNDNLTDYISKGKAKAWEFSPENPEVIKKYRDLIQLISK